MNISKTLLFTLSLILFIGCSRDETPTPQPDAEEQPKADPKPDEPEEPKSEKYFSYYDDPNDTYLNWTDSWIIIHNQNGELLDYKLFKKGDSLDFEGTTEKLKNTSTLSITYLLYSSKDTGGHNHLVSTKTGISLGTVWDWTDEHEPGIFNQPSTNLAQPLIKVNNVPNVQRFDLTSQPTGAVEGHHFYLETNVLQISALLHYEVDYFLSLRDGNDDVKYKFFQLPYNPDSHILSLEYDSFLEYDHILEVELPEHREYSASVSAKKSSENYMRGLDISNESAGRQSRSTAKLGYLNSYDVFRTSVILHYDEYIRYNFYKIGEIPDKILIPPSPNFEVTNENIYDYDYITNVGHWANTSEWIYKDDVQDHTTRYVITGKFDIDAVIGALPDEVLNGYPHLNLDQLTYQSTTLRIDQGNENHSDNRTTLQGVILPTFIESITFLNE